MTKKKTEIETEIPAVDKVTEQQKTVPPCVPRTVYHRVAASDTLDSIAKLYGTDRAEIIGANQRQYPSILRGRIEAGWTLTVRTCR